MTPVPNPTADPNNAASTALFTAASALVFLGAVLGGIFFPADRKPVHPMDTAEVFFRYDGGHYRDIAENGYQYDPAARSNLAFFPAYPLFARGVAAVLPIGIEASLLLVSNGLLFATMALLHAYTRCRFPETGAFVPLATVAAFAFFPPTMFFHMAYSESTLLVPVLACLIAIQWNAPPWVVALLAGLATATRPVGVALVPVVALYLWRRSPGVRSFVLHSFWLVPLSAWGILAYMFYQHVAFGDAFAFARTQKHWQSIREFTFAEKLESLATFEPIWGSFLPSSPRYWGRQDTCQEPIFSLAFLNPLVFLGAMLTVGAGAVAKVLNRYEVILAAGLLLIPYVTKGYENSMFSMARFSAAVLPCYLVWGRSAGLLPPAVGLGVVGVGGFFLGVFAAMFAAGHLYF